MHIQREYLAQLPRRPRPPITILSGMLLILVACGGGGGSGFDGGDLGTPYDLLITGISITSVSLEWQYSGPAESTTGFRIYRDGKLVDWTSVESAIDHQLWPSTNYCYQVTAYNFWSESKASNTVCTSTDVDQLPPSTPGDLVVLMSAGSEVSLSWTESSDNHQVASYRIVRDSRDLLTVAGTSVVDSSAVMGAEYCYSVTAIDSTGNESEQTPVACVDTDWFTMILDENNEIEGGIDISLDSAGHVHISYYDRTNGEIKYATSTGGIWSIVPIDYIGEDRWYPDTSITVDTNGLVHLCYFDPINLELKYATNGGGVWSNHRIDGGGNIGNECSIATDSLNNAHIIYPNNGLVHATNSTGNWVSSLVPGTFGAGLSSLGIDSSDNLHASYSIPGPELHYATNQSGEWQSQILDVASAGGSLWYSSIGVDSFNNVHVAYGCLRYITNKTGSWISDEITAGVEICYPSIAVDSRDKLHISYRNGRLSTGLFTYTAALKYITNKSGIWIDYTIEKGAITGFNSAITADLNSNAYIASLSNFQLAYATNR